MTEEKLGLERLNFQKQDKQYISIIRLSKKRNQVESLEISII